MNGSFMGSKRLFDDSCAICMDNFSVGEEVIITPCEHSFHERCLDLHVKNQIDSMLRMYKRMNGSKTIENLEKELGPSCPTCNLSLIHQARHQSLSYSSSVPFTEQKLININDIVLQNK